MRHIVTLALTGALAAIHAREPDIYFLEYQSFIPDKHFSNIAGPDQPLLTVINTESEWKSLWTSIEPRMSRDMGQSQPHPVPRIDFARYSLVVVALGRNGGQSVAIEAIRNLGSRIAVSLVALRPGPGCLVTTDVRYPIALALIARTDKPIDFGVTDALITCESKSR